MTATNPDDLEREAVTHRTSALARDDVPEQFHCRLY